MEALLNRYRNLTVLLLVVSAQVLVLGYQVRTQQDVRLVRVWAVTAVTPLARVLEFVRRNTIGIAEDYFVLINVRDENNRLAKEVGRLKLENQFLRTELQTADRARALQAFQSRTPSKTIAARIIGNGTGTNSRVVFVDRGASSGVERGMAVVTPDGIVGKVLASYPTASQVLLVNDANFAAGVVSQNNRVHGTVKGTGQSKLVVDYVQNEEKVEVGEIFFTSGDDRIFPKGMPVGIVSVVRPGRTFKEIYLVPTGTQNGIEELLIVVEGVHQPIPDAASMQVSGYRVLPPPPPGDSPETAAQTGVDPMSRALQTDADRIKERYKKIGEAQSHKFGEGTPGSRPPDFTIDPDKAARQTAATVAAEPRPKPPAPAGPGTANVSPVPAPATRATAPASKPPAQGNTAIASPAGNPPRTAPAGNASSRQSGLSNATAVSTPVRTTGSSPSSGAVPKTVLPPAAPRATPLTRPPVNFTNPAPARKTPAPNGVSVGMTVTEGAGQRTAEPPPRPRPAAPATKQPSAPPQP